jgi:hypothetical protein
VRHVWRSLVAWASGRSDVSLEGLYGKAGPHPLSPLLYRLPLAPSMFPLHIRGGDRCILTLIVAHEGKSSFCYRVPWVPSALLVARHHRMETLLPYHPVTLTAHYMPLCRAILSHGIASEPSCTPRHRINSSAAASCSCHFAAIPTCSGRVINCPAPTGA